MYTRYYNHATERNTRKQLLKRKALKVLEFAGWFTMVYITTVIILSI